MNKNYKSVVTWRILILPHISQMGDFKLQVLYFFTRKFSDRLKCVGRSGAFAPPAACHDGTVHRFNNHWMKRTSRVAAKWHLIPSNGYIKGVHSIDNPTGRSSMLPGKSWGEVKPGRDFFFTWQINKTRTFALHINDCCYEMRFDSRKCVKMLLRPWCTSPGTRRESSKCFPRPHNWILVERERTAEKMEKGRGGKGEEGREERRGWLVRLEGRLLPGAEGMDAMQSPWVWQTDRQTTLTTVTWSQ